MNESSRRGFLKTTVLGGAMASGAVLLPADLARASEGRSQREHDCGCPPAPGGPAEPEYTLRVVNNSTEFQDLCVFQAPSVVDVTYALALAWMTAPAWPTTTATFTWKPDYDFVWGNTGPLTPGVIFDAGQTWPADPGDPDLQQVRLTYARGAFTFERDQVTPNPAPGSLVIGEMNTIPPHEAAVGIGMSGAGFMVVPAQPNMNLVFTPHPAYWVTAGSFATGEVIDIEQLPNRAAVHFAPGVHSMIATLNPDDTWSVRDAGA